MNPPLTWERVERGWYTSRPAGAGVVLEADGYWHVYVVHGSPPGDAQWLTLADAKRSAARLLAAKSADPDGYRAAVAKGGRR